MSSQLLGICGEQLELLPERALFWHDRQTLIISDVHLGKAGHFRKHGIPISKKVHLTDLKIIDQLIKRLSPSRVILLGDLFHSSENNEWKYFLVFIEVHHQVQFILIEGNHDILTNYPSALQVTPRLVEGPFSFTHMMEEGDKYNISGHIHPGVSVKGKGRQTITMPCFLFSKNYGLMPAFGQFTGLKKIKPNSDDRVFAIAEGFVIELI